MIRHLFPRGRHFHGGMIANRLRVVTADASTATTDATATAVVSRFFAAVQDHRGHRREAPQAVRPNVFSGRSRTAACRHFPPTLTAFRAEQPRRSSCTRVLWLIRIITILYIVFGERRRPEPSSRRAVSAFTLPNRAGAPTPTNSSNSLYKLPPWKTRNPNSS